MPGSVVTENADDDGTRLVVRQRSAQIKIEVTPVLRGTVHPVDLRTVHPAAEGRFGFAEIQVVSFADLYAGKMVAALHRQHPRDLFDVQYLFRNDGINDSLFQTFFAYSVSSTTWFGTNRSIAGDYENWGRDSVRVDLGVFPPRSSQLGLCAHRSRFKIKVVSRIPQTQARSLPAQSVRKIGPGFFRPDDLNHVSSLIGRMAGNYRADRSPHQSR